MKGLRKIFFTFSVSLLIGIFTMSQVCYATGFVSDLRMSRTSETTAKDLVADFLGTEDEITLRSQFKIGQQAVTAVPGNIATKTSALTAAVLTNMGLRGKALGLDKNIPKQKAEISRIKDQSDGVAKKIYESAVQEEGVTLRVRVSEGFDRDGVAESFKANDIINPGGAQGTNDAIIDVIEGTNAFVTDVGGKKLENLEDWESGATSIIVTGPGVESLGNCPDYYVDTIFTLVPGEAKQDFIDDPLDPELTAGKPEKIEYQLSRIAEANNIGIEDIEVMVMEREREDQRLDVLRKLQEKYPGLRLVTIIDGTVAHALQATFGRKQGKHKVVMTVGGAPEGFLNLAVTGIFKEEGALGSMRICSKDVNTTLAGGIAHDLSRRYDFNEKEQAKIRELRPQDAEDILKGNKLFTQEDVIGDVEGSFAFITDNGVFGIKGVERLTGSIYEGTILRVGKINGRPSEWFEKRVFDLSLTGRTMFDALKQTEQGRKAVIMAVNIRLPLSLDGIIQGAQETDSVVIFQQAMSELGYTWPSGKGFEPDNAYRFVAEVRDAAERNNFTDYVIKGDHVTVKADKAFLADQDAQDRIVTLFDNILAEEDNAKRIAMLLDALEDKEFMANPNVANGMNAVKEAYTLVRAEVDSGMTVFALDASFMPMPLNVRITAFLAGLIPNNCSIEGEVGEIGGTDNSTIADALEFVTGVRYAENVERDPVTNAIVFSGLVVENGKPVVERKDKGLLSYGVKIDRIALNNGTAHGNNYDKDGNLIQTKMNLIMTAAITKALAPYGIEIVQHGTTGTPLENLPALRAAGITEAHVGTNWQNIAWEVLTEEAKSSPEAAAVVDSMIDMLVSNYGEKYNVTDRATADPKDLEKLIGKELKLSLGAYKARLAALPDDIKAKINIATKENETIGASAHFKAFDSAGTASLVRKFAAIGKPPVLMGGRSLMTIAQELEWVGGEEQMIYLTDDQHRRFHLLQEEFIALNKIGALADDLEGILENSKNPESGLNPEDVDSGIAKVLNAVSSNRLNRVQGKQDVIVLPASEVSMLDGEQFFGLKDFLDLARSKDKVVVIVAANEPGKDTTFDITGKERLDDISRRFSKATTYKLESLAWLKDLKDLNLDQLRPLSELYAKHGLALECTLEKLQNKSLADAIARGI